MGALDYPFINGTNDQKREYFYKRITYYFPELAGTPDLIYGDLELIYLRYVNEGLIPDSTEDLQTHINTLNTEVLNGYYEPVSAWWQGVVDKLKSLFVQKDINVVYFKDYGVADGITDDTSALVASAAKAAANGVALELPAGRTIAISGYTKLPDNLTLRTNGSKFQALTENANFGLGIGSGSRITGGLIYYTVSGGLNVRGIFISGATDILIDLIQVVSVTPSAGIGDSYDSALSIDNSSNIHIGQVLIKNFDYPVKIERSNRITIEYVDINTYVRGIYLNETTYFYLNSGQTYGTSPQANAQPGHNGILIGADTHNGTSDIYINNFTVRDAAEHGFRIGGVFKVTKVFYNNCIAKSTGGCGFKVLGGKVGDNNYHENINYLNCLAEDCGQDNSASAGFMLQFVKHCQVINPIVRKKWKAFSAGSGVNIQAAENVTVTNPIITDTIEVGYKVGFVLGDCTNVKLIGGIITSSTGDGIVLDFTNRTFRRVSIEGWPQVDISGTGYCVNVIGAGTGTIVGGSLITWQSVQTAARQFTGNLNYYFCDVFAPFAGDPGFKNGSKWTDNTSGVIRFKNTTWKTPTLT